MCCLVWETAERVDDNYIQRCVTASFSRVLDRRYVLEQLAHEERDIANLILQVISRTNLPLLAMAMIALL